MRSLSSRLFVLWLLSLIALIGVGVLLFQLFRVSMRAEVQRAEAVVARACEMIGNRYAFYTTGWNGSDLGTYRHGLPAVVTMALAGELGIEGGIWQDGAGSLAYAFPTYPGTGPKTDLPIAEKARIEAINQRAAREEQSVLSVAAASRETLVLLACPLGGPIPGITAWTMTRVERAPGYQPLRLGLGVLALLLVGESGWLLFLASSWSRRVRGLAASLGGNQAALARLRLTGDPDLDRVVGALNEAGRRLEAARRQAAELALRIGKAERLAALGRMAQGFAHEIRNPMAAMRLKAENVLAAGQAGPTTEALRSILTQIMRIDRLVGELLEMTRGRTVTASRVDLEEFLAATARDYRDVAAARGVRLSSGSTIAAGEFDPILMRQAIGNLIQNAIRHAREGGEVRVSAGRSGGMLRIEVADDGEGVAAEIRENLFEPFVTGVADGTGLGLAIVREIVEAQGGEVQLASPGGDGTATVFAIDLPWRAS